MGYCIRSSVSQRRSERRIFHRSMPASSSCRRSCIRRFGGSHFRQISLLAGVGGGQHSRKIILNSDDGRAVVQMICARIPVEDNAFGRLSVGLNRVCWTRRSDCRLMDGDARLFDPHSSSIRGPGSIVLPWRVYVYTPIYARARASCGSLSFGCIK